MSVTQIANTYSTSLYEMAIEKNCITSVMKDVEFIITSIKNNVELKQLLSSPLVNPDKKAKILKELFSECNELTSNFIQLLTKRRRENYLLDICVETKKLFNKDNQIVETQVTTATPISEEANNDVISYIKEITGAKKVLINNIINPEIIGGLVIKYDDKLIDTSVLTQIKKIKKEFNIA